MTYVKWFRMQTDICHHHIISIHSINYYTYLKRHLHHVTFISAKWTSSSDQLISFVKDFYSGARYALAYKVKYCIWYHHKKTVYFSWRNWLLCMIWLLMSSLFHLNSLWGKWKYVTFYLVVPITREFLQLPRQNY